MAQDTEKRGESRPGQVVVRRMRELRDQRGWTAAQLAQRMQALGVPWKREIVANLEAGRRAGITVDELLALALALGVPVPWLLAEPNSVVPMSVAEGVEVDPGSVLLWLTGKRPLTDRAGPEWDKAAHIIGRLNAMDDANAALSKLGEIDRDASADHPPTAEQKAAHELLVRRQLDIISSSLTILEAFGVAVRLPESVVLRARDFDIELPEFPLWPALPLGSQGGGGGDRASR